MSIELNQVVIFITIISAVAGGIWRFHTFSKKMAERETNMHNKIDNLSEQNHAIKEDMNKHSDRTDKIEAEHTRNLKEFGEKIDSKIEKLDQKHAQTYERGMAEVKGLVDQTNKKLDRLVEIMLSDGKK